LGKEASWVHPAADTKLIIFSFMSGTYLTNNWCRKTIKATVVLFFFLGMTSLLFFINPR
jgi:hypothetical protein